MRHTVVFFFWGLLLLGTSALPAQDRRFKLPNELWEVSGLAIVSADSLWWHNDGGDQARLLLTNGSGRLLHSVVLPGARNIDWEDLTIDPSGRLYVGDFGDNAYRRPELLVYRYDPASGVLDSIRFRYPDGKRYNVEGFFWHRDSLHLFTKGDLPKDFVTHHFALPAAVGSHQAQWRDSLVLPRRVVTAAAIQAEDGRVVLLSYYYRRLLGFIPRSMASVFVLEDYPDGHYLRGRLRHQRISCVIATQYESIDFMGTQYVLAASEKTVFIRPRAKRVRLKD